MKTLTEPTGNIRFTWNSIGEFDQATFLIRGIKCLVVRARGKYVVYNPLCEHNGLPNKNTFNSAIGSVRFLFKNAELIDDSKI